MAADCQAVGICSQPPSAVLARGFAYYNRARGRLQLAADPEARRSESRSQPLQDVQMMCQDLQRHVIEDDDGLSVVNEISATKDMEAATLSDSSDFLVAGAKPHLWYCSSRGFVFLPLPTYTSYYTIYDDATPNNNH